MAEEYVSVSYEGFDELERALEGMEATKTRKIRGMLEGMGTFTVYTLRQNVPVLSGDTLRRTRQSGIKWRPGGAGGGGEYEVIVGIVAGSMAPVYADRGTGIYVGHNRITPRHDRAAASVVATRRARINAANTIDRRTFPALTFQKRGEVRKFRAWVSGQRPQHFLYQTFMQADIYARARAHTFGRDILSPR